MRTTTIKMSLWGLPALLGAMLLGGAGCPAASVKPTEAALSAEAMPTDPQKLIALADEQFAKGGVQNSRVALLRALAKNPDWAASKDAYQADWRLMRADAELASGDNDEQKKTASAAGIAVGRKALALDPGRVEAPYYLAQLVGYSAQANKGDSKGMLVEMAQLLEQADKIDASFDHGGPARVLGALYARAPQPPLSIGDPDKAVQLMQRAVQLDPSYPANTIFLADALVADERYPDAATAIKAARQMLADPRWERYHGVWTQELDRVDRKLRAKTG